MTSRCQRLQDTLAEQGPAAFRSDEAARRHLEDCADCFAMLESLAALDAGFDAMPAIDASDELVEALLARDELRSTTPVRPTADRLSARDEGEVARRPARPSLTAVLGSGLRQLFGPGRPRLKAAVAFALLAVICMPAYVHFKTRQRVEMEYLGVDVMPAETQQGAGDTSWREFAAAGDGRSDISVVPVSDGAAPVPGAAPSPRVSEVTQGQLQALGYVGGGGKLDEKKAELSLDPGLAGAKGAKDEELPEEELLDRLSIGRDVDSPVWVGTETHVTFRGGSPRIESDVSGPFDEDADARQRVRDRLRDRLRSLPRGLQDAEGERAENAPAGPEAGKKAKDAPDPSEIEKVELPDAMALARGFLAGRDDTGVPSQPADGYWSNTYVPGDPVLRYLQARLAGRDRSLLATGGEPPSLHDAARRTTQPFDPPAGAALGVQLQADRSAALGETRMLMQVGLAATPRHGGRRPAMNVAVVFDLRGEIEPVTAAGLVALAAAFGEGRDLGDRFRLIVAGRGTGEVVAPEDFRRGPLVVATGSLLAEGPAHQTESLGLASAVRAAIAAVAGGDDPTAPLGSSAIVVATTQPLGEEVEGLIELARESAAAGMPLSVVGVGDGVELAELDRLALTGQGSRRLLREPAEARGLVDRELAAVSRAVARAVRLRIALAPGVRLVDVVGARRHGQDVVEWVRRTERAIDQRLARNLGIQADRGDDEAGIQIVIPTLYAGDHHVVLLDVVAPGPGPIADVTVRYKDLVQLENGVARARLDLKRGEGARGPLERNVLKNLLAHQLREVLENAGRDVREGGREAATRRLDAHRRLLAGLRLELAGFERDRDLDRDVAMLDEYVQLLSSPANETPERRLYLADSLRYAGRLKVLPAPMPVGGAK